MSNLRGDEVREDPEYKRARLNQDGMPNSDMVEEDALSDSSNESNRLRSNNNQNTSGPNEIQGQGVGSFYMPHMNNGSVNQLTAQQQQQQQMMQLAAIHQMNQMPLQSPHLTQTQLHQHQMAMAAMAHNLPMHMIARLGQLPPIQQQQFHMQHQLYLQKLQQIQQAQARGQIIPPQQIQMVQAHQHYLALLLAGGPNPQTMNPHTLQASSTQQQQPTTTTAPGFNPQNRPPPNFHPHGMVNPNPMSPQFLPSGHPLSHLTPQQQHQLHQNSLHGLNPMNNLISSNNGMNTKNNPHLSMNMNANTPMTLPPHMSRPPGAAHMNMNPLGGNHHDNSTNTNTAATTNGPNEGGNSATSQTQPKIPLPPWLQSHGEKRHSEKQLSSQADLSKTKKKYRMSLCTYCAQIYPQSPWATLKSRKFEHEIFRKHEKSNLHQRALLELNKSVVNGNPMALQVALGNIPLSGITNHNLNNNNSSSGNTGNNGNNNTNTLKNRVNNTSGNTSSASSGSSPNEVQYPNFHSDQLMSTNGTSGNTENNENNLNNSHFLLNMNINNNVVTNHYSDENNGTNFKEDDEEDEDNNPNNNNLNTNSSDLIYSQQQLQQPYSSISGNMDMDTYPQNFNNTTTTGSSNNDMGSGQSSSGSHSSSNQMNPYHQNPIQQSYIPSVQSSSSNSSSSQSHSITTTAAATVAVIPDPVWCQTYEDIPSSNTDNNNTMTQQNTDNHLLKYKRMICIYCAEFNPNSPWGRVQMRPYNTDTFLDHEKSSHHERAVHEREIFTNRQLSHGNTNMLRATPMASAALVSSSLHHKISNTTTTNSNITNTTTTSGGVGGGGLSGNPSPTGPSSAASASSTATSHTTAAVDGVGGGHNISDPTTHNNPNPSSSGTGTGTSNNGSNNQANRLYTKPPNIHFPLASLVKTPLYNPTNSPSVPNAHFPLATHNLKESPYYDHSYGYGNSPNIPTSSSTVTAASASGGGNMKNTSSNTNTMKLHSSGSSGSSEHSANIRSNPSPLTLNQIQNVGRSNIQGNDNTNYEYNNTLGSTSIPKSVSMDNNSVTSSTSSNDN